jgi:tape measure domain-containing protein
VAERVGGIFYEVEFNTAKMIDGQRRVDRELTGMATRLTAAAAAVAVLAASLAALKTAKIADEFRMLGARVEVAAGSIESAGAAMDELIAISRRTQTSLAGNIDVFTRLNQSILQMGGTQADTLRVTELLAKAIKVSGASAVEAKAAMLQFGQSLGSGKLAGDELRSLLENAPYLMRQLADGIGVPVGALKQLGEEGKLTADIVVNALTKAAAKIDADFRKFPQTIEAAMVVAQDSAALAALKFDELSGTSAALTGIVKGTGQVLEKLAEQFGAANTEAGNLGRNDAVSTWAKRTTKLLSYVLDAADGVKRAVELIGIGIGGLAAKGEALLTFNLAKARARFAEINAAAKADVDALLNTPLAGAQIRERLDQGAGGGRGFVNPTGPASALKPPPGAKSGGKEKKPPRDFFNEDQDKLEERLRIAYDRIADSEIEAADKARAKVEEEQKKGRGFAAGLMLQGNEIAQLEAELEAKSALLLQFAAQDQANAELYAEARLNLEQQTTAKIGEIVQRGREQELAQQAALLQAYGGLFGNMSDLLKRTGKERTALSKALFLTQKAIAVAEIILNTEVAAAKAGAQLGIFGIPMATAIRAAGYASAGMVAGLAIGEVAGGRQYGGPTSAGSLYRVNEAGRPEMFTAANGAQYMLPTQSGSVTAADRIGGAARINVVVQNTGTPQQVQSQSFDQQTNTLRLVTADLVDQISNNSGPVWSALRSSTNVQGRIS